MKKLDFNELKYSCSKEPKTLISMIGEHGSGGMVELKRRIRFNEKYKMSLDDCQYVHIKIHPSSGNIIICCYNENMLKLWETDRTVHNIIRRYETRLEEGRQHRGFRHVSFGKYWVKEKHEEEFVMAAIHNSHNNDDNDRTFSITPVSTFVHKTKIQTRLSLYSEIAAGKGVHDVSFNRNIRAVACKKLIHFSSPKKHFHLRTSKILRLGNNCHSNMNLMPGPEPGTFFVQCSIDVRELQLDTDTMKLSKMIPYCIHGVSMDLIGYDVSKRFVVTHFLSGDIETNPQGKTVFKYGSILVSDAINEKFTHCIALFSRRIEKAGMENLIKVIKVPDIANENFQIHPSEKRRIEDEEDDEVSEEEQTRGKKQMFNALTNKKNTRIQIVGDFIVLSKMNFVFIFYLYSGKCIHYWDIEIFTKDICCKFDSKKKKIEIFVVGSYGMGNLTEKEKQLMVKKLVFLYSEKCRNCFKMMIATGRKKNRKKKKKNKLRMRRCGGCGTVRYCTRECQKSDWKRHEPFCNSRIF